MTQDLAYPKKKECEEKGGQLLANTILKRKNFSQSLWLGKLFEREGGVAGEGFSSTTNQVG